METDDLNRKIFGAIGKHRKHHMSDIKDPRSRVVITEPGRRGYFNINTAQPGKIYDVYCDGGCIGRMDYNAILQKFGRV
jgi:hypothetical protein